ncbi:MAG TPA: hypothetical protein VII06_31175 [Chloroflexota bacterium]|jgi:hypothetical protein
MLGRTFAPGPNDLPRGPGWGAGRPARNPVSFSVGDGFKFGCGFMLALAIGLLAMALLLALVVLLAMIMGANLQTFLRPPG